MKHWLMKTEPELFSIDDLEKRKTSLWDGVRNYQARNYMKEMKLGDEILFYHSSTEPPGVAGLARVVGLAEPDPTQFDKKSDYFDPKATAAAPIWFCIRAGFGEKFSRLVPLEELRKETSLADMLLLRKGQRLSVQPVTAKEFACIRKMASR